MTRIIVNKSTDNAKPHSNVFYHNILTNKENAIFSEHKLKKALCDMLMPAVLSGLLATTAN